MASWEKKDRVNAGEEAVWWWQAVTIGIGLYGGRGEAERLSGRTGSFALLLDGGLRRPGLSVSADDSIPVEIMQRDAV